eukprot:scaffold16066_cov109-Cylindrotheca_fusiformis.AAC.1
MTLHHHQRKRRTSKKKQKVMPLRKFRLSFMTMFGSATEEELSEFRYQNQRVDIKLVRGAKSVPIVLKPQSSVAVSADSISMVADSMLSVCRETATTWPPNVNRSVPTIVFLAGVTLSLMGNKFSRKLGYNEAEPDWFLSIFFNAYGSLLILVCAVWLVDGLYLAWLGCTGKEGDLQNWWWRDGLLFSNSQSNAAVYQQQQQQQQEVNDGINLDSNSITPTTTTEHSIIGDTDAKAMRLDAERSSAKKRVVLILILYVWWTAWSRAAAYSPHILELSVPVPRLPLQCDGYRLGMASDLHAGTMSSAKDTKWMVEHLNGLQPDAVALVGDIGDQPVNDFLKQKLAPLTQLQAPDGIYYTFGNHENKYHIDDFRTMFRTESPFADKITLLENEHTILTKGYSEGCSIVLMGMADMSGVKGQKEGQVAPNVALALHSTPGPNGSTIHSDTIPSPSLPMIMMQHQPRNMTQAAKDGVGLQLSGHTHGGQLWPQHVFLGWYDAISGLHKFDVGSPDGPSYLFVSEGVVGWGPRLRFLSKTDIALLTLRSPEQMAAEGKVPDTHLTLATFAMYLAMVLVPSSLIACYVPTLCWAKHNIRIRRKRRSSDYGDELVNEEEEEADEEEVANSTILEDESRNLV